MTMMQSGRNPLQSAGATGVIVGEPWTLSAMMHSDPQHELALDVRRATRGPSGAHAGLSGIGPGNAALMKQIILCSRYRTPFTGPPESITSDAITGVSEWQP